MYTFLEESHQVTWANLELKAQPEPDLDLVILLLQLLA